MRGHSIGGFGSVTTNKVIATIAGDVFGKDVQAYPKYGSEKKGLPTTYYLTIADSHIYSHSELEHVDLVVLNDTTALLSGNPLKGLVAGGAIFMQSPYADPADVWERIPPHHQRTIREKRPPRLFRRHGPDRPRGRFGRRPPDADAGHRPARRLPRADAVRDRELGMSDEQVYAGVEKALRKYFGKRGDRVVQDNLTCVKRGYNEMQEIPTSRSSTGPLRRPAGDRPVRDPRRRDSPPSANPFRPIAPTASSKGSGPWRRLHEPCLDERGQSARPAQQQLLRHAGGPRLQASALPVLDVLDFNERIIRGYEEGDAEKDLPADLSMARSLVPAGHGQPPRLQQRRPGDPGLHRRELHRLHGVRHRVPRHGDPGQGPGRAGAGGEARGPSRTRPTASVFAPQWSKPRKYYDGPEKQGKPGGRFAIIIDPSKCKGCAECVTVCDDKALKMVAEDRAG